MPAEVAERLTGVRTDKGLTATIRATRDRYRLLYRDEDSWHAEIADDHGQALRGNRQLTWWEIETELGSGCGLIAVPFVDELEAAGGGDPLSVQAVVPVPPVHSPGRPDGTGTFADDLVNQIDAVFTDDLGLRRGHDPIHHIPVTTRLRSTLRVFAKLLDPGAAGDIDDDLRWFAGLLGESATVTFWLSRLPPPKTADF